MAWRTYKTLRSPTGISSIKRFFGGSRGAVFSKKAPLAVLKRAIIGPFDGGEVVSQDFRFGNL
jgi:hypothetical protein